MVRKLVPYEVILVALIFFPLLWQSKQLQIEAMDVLKVDEGINNNNY